MSVELTVLLQEGMKLRRKCHPEGLTHFGPEPEVSQAQTLTCLTACLKVAEPANFKLSGQN